MSTWFGAHDVTVSWSIISEALNRSRHEKQTHSAGLLIGDSSEHVSVHHCLLANNDFRNPLISKGGTHDIVNNVVYDWGAIPAEVFDTDSNSFPKVLAEAGATRPERDEVDRRVVAEVQNKAGKTIDSPAAAGGYPELAPGAAPPDSDHDGMPGQWERQHGLDSQDASAGHKDREGAHCRCG